MKGAYLVRLNLAEPHLKGVANKIRGQIDTFSKAFSGMDFYYLSHQNIMKNERILKSSSSGAFMRRFVYYFLFYYFLAQQKITADFIYIRYQRSSPLFLYFLAKLKAKNPKLIILVEVPSYPYHTENSSFRDHLFGLIDRASTPFLKRYIDRIVTFSKQTEIFGIATIRTDNGIDVDKIKLIPVTSENDEIRLIGVANLSFWHGYDRVIEGLKNYYATGGNRKVYFDIVGAGNELERLKEDAADAGLIDKVRFHGPLHGAQLDKVFYSSYIGISSIGMHRLNVDTSNLKSREFCARGIPFIIAYPDRDFGEELPFVFHASENDEPINIETLLTFYTELRCMHPFFQVAMRDYAESTLSWEAKLQPVIDVINGNQNKFFSKSLLN